MDAPGGPHPAVVRAGQLVGRAIRPLVDEAVQPREIHRRPPAAPFDQGGDRSGLAVPLDPANQRGHTDRKLRRHVAVPVGPVLVRTHSSLPQGDRIRIRGYIRVSQLTNCAHKAVS